jgi:hypothetical protein
MNERLQSGMRGASRLIRAGQLTEATALLQGVTSRFAQNRTLSGLG